MRKRTDLHAYQRRAVEYIKTKRRCALFLQMGLGKSIITLTALTDLSDSLAVDRVLVIAPLRVANTVWRQEAAAWEHTAGLNVSVCTGAAATRRRRLNADADIHVINRENVPWLVKEYGPKKWPFDAVVIDESDSVKNWQSKRWKALRSILPRTQYMILLTGTPSPNSLMDLWAQVYLIDSGERLGKTVTGFKERYFDQDYMGYNWYPKEGTEEAIHNKLSDIALSMTSEEYNQLPERIDLNVPVTLPKAAQDYYCELEKELLAELPTGEEIEAVNAAVLANKLLQCANGCVYTDEQHNWQQLHKAKLEALQEIVADNPSENILVAYNFKSDLAVLQQAFPDAAVLDKSERTINKWNNGKIKMLLCHPSSSGHGVNLQHGGSLLVWYGLNWSLGLYAQMNGRLHRQGQTRSVRIAHIVAEGTIDERVLSVLHSKHQTQRDLINALKV